MKITMIRSAPLALFTVLAASALGALAGCQRQTPATLPTGAPAATTAPAVAAPASPVDRTAVPSGRGQAPAVDRSGTVEERLARLEDAYAQNATALAFLRQVYEAQQAQQAEREHDELAEDAMFAVDITEDVKAGQVDGPATAPVTIVKAFDFACPYCQRMVATLDALIAEYRGKIRVVYVNLVVHEPARAAHLASCAAAKQGKYKQFTAAFWENGFLPYAASQGQNAAPLGEDNILVIAKGLGLDAARLKTDMAGRDCEARIKRDMEEMAKFHVNATPTFFINGKPRSGAIEKARFKAMIDEELAIVERSGVPAAQYYAKVVLGKGEKQFRSKADPKP